MTIEQAEALVKGLYEMGIEAKMREGYSGRGMYGTEVVAIVSDDSNIKTAIGYAAVEAGIDWNDLPHRQDNMGLGWVVY